ncbi:MAG: OsmC family peroxiredoxin [Bacteroidetes bacterium]|nr:MAG: OsmC family peroxiredoxin [Bacteroidota bacterium]
MLTSKVKYLGNLRTSCTHLRSNTEIITDAPVDNQGRGESFSPTDLVATAYASCMITIMGIHCQEHGIPFHHAEAEVEKVMGSNPRKIAKIRLKMDLSENHWEEEQANRVIRAGKRCPVALNLENGLDFELEFIV